MIKVNNEQSAEKRTIGIVARVTEFSECSTEMGNMTSVFCEYWDEEKIYVFQSIPVSNNLQLSIGDPVEVFVDPNDFSNYYVSIYDYLAIKSEQNNMYEKIDKKLGVQKAYEEIEDAKQQQMVIVKVCWILIACFIYYLGRHDYINYVVAFILTIFLIISLQVIEGKLVGKERTSAKELERQINESIYQYKYFYYISMIILNLYCVYTRFFKEIEVHIIILFFTIGVDLIVLYFRYKK